MKSCLGLLFTLLILIAIVGTGAALWYLSDTAAFSKQEIRATP